ncbi:MAG: hypothetical protein ACRDF7_03185 [Candidatus Limnocylindrales bacterium]
MYLMRAYDIAAERQREIERDRRVREFRQAVSAGPRPLVRRPNDRRPDGR